MKIRKITGLLPLFALMIMFSCSSDDDNTTPDPTPATPDPVAGPSKYFLALSLPTIESYPFHVLSSIDEGTAHIDQSQEIPGLPNNVPVTTQSGFIFLNSAEKLTKYSVDEEGILVDEGSAPNLGISGGPVFEFLNEDELMISTGPREAKDGKFQYQIISTATMTEISKGTITLPTDENSNAIPSAYILKEGKIFVPYIHSNAEYKAYDEAPVAIFDAETMEYEKTIYDDRTASLAYSVVSSHGFSEEGDLYITSCNSSYWGGNESLPSGILRIKAGEDDFDEDYFFNLTEKFEGNHTGGMLYVGNKKAIVQVFRSDLIQEFRDYQGDFVIEYHLVDLETKEVEQLDVPLSKYPRKALSLLKNGKAVIVANTENEGNALYIFDPATQEVTKGLTYEGAEFINAFMSFE